MDSYKRQLSILYELMPMGLYRTYKELEHKFDITERTLRSDISAINYLFNKQGISIELEKNKGLYLHTNTKEIRSALCNNLEHRFVDLNDISTGNSSLLHKIMSLFLSKRSFIKIDDLAEELCINPRTITDILKSVRRELDKYNLTIRTKPHHGMYLSGNEINVRSFYSDTITYEGGLTIDVDLFEDSVTSYGLSETDKHEITMICLNIFGKSRTKLDFASIKKLVLYILISEQRYRLGKAISLDDEQVKIINSFPNIDGLDVLIEKLNHYQFIKDENERLYLKIILYVNSNITEDFYLYLNLPYWLTCRVKHLQQIIVTTLMDRGIVTYDGIERLLKMIQPLLFQSVLRTKFSILEYNANIALKKAIKQSPLSANIGYLVQRAIESELGSNIGNMMAIRMSITIYAWIREVCNNCLSSKLALLVPFTYESGMTIKRRIMDRFANNIESMDILMPCDLPSIDINCYDALLYIDAIPSELNVTIPTLKVDFYFTEQDVSNFYENIIIPMRRYVRCFSNLKASDYIVNYHYINFETFMMDLAYANINTSIYEDIINKQPTVTDIYNYTLSLIYFTKNKSECFSKLLILDTYDEIHNARFNRIFIHVIALEGNLIGLKTSEKVTRNLICIDDTEEVINEKVDFYEYYIHLSKIPLLSSK